jgi:hypothetical protein
MKIPSGEFAINKTGWANKIRQTLGQRRWRLYLSACCRGLFKNPNQADASKAFDINDRFADTGKTKAALKEANALSYWNKGFKEPKFTEDNFHLQYLGDAGELLQELLVPNLKNELLPRMGIGAQWNLRMKPAAARDYLQRILDDFEAPAGVAKRFNAAWRTADVVGLAHGIYRDRAFDRMPVLGDALMDAGCADKEILDHCRAKIVHVRGCWVLDLILDGHWDMVWSDQKPKKPTAKAKAAKATAASPFRPKPSQAREINDYMKSAAKLSAADSIASSYAEHQKYRKTAVENTMQYLGYSAEQAEASCAFGCLGSPGLWRERAIARRVRLDDPRELAEHVCLEARREWIAYGDEKEDRTQRLNQLIPAVALHDHVLEKRILEMSPYPLKSGHPDDVCLYNAVFSVLKGNLDAFRRRLPYEPKRKTNRHWNAALQCLQAAAQNKPDLFRDSLEELLEIERRSNWLASLISVFGHGIYEICQRAAPKVVESFDVNQEPPWDAAFHRWIQERDDPLKEFDWTKIPDEIRDGLRNMTRPIWWGAA